MSPAYADWRKAPEVEKDKLSTRIKVNVIIRIVITVLLCIPLLVCTPVFAAGEKKKMEPLYDFKDVLTLKPQIYKTGVRNSLSLFPVPFDNAVGTNDYRNAITIISFAKGKLSIDHHFQRAVDDIQGGGTYLPVITPDLIGFGQMRAFYIFNFKRKIHDEYRIVFPIDETIEKIAIADAERRRFIFEIKEYNRHSEDHHDVTKSLQLIDLYGKEVKLIKKAPKQLGSIWAAAYDRIFVWHISKKSIAVYDMNLEPSQHILADVIRKNSQKEEFRFNRIHPHPTLSFSIFSGGKYGAMFISWDENRQNNPIKLFSGADQFAFSPDGKWVAFKKEDFKLDKSFTYLMPVSEKYPNYLGTPILLMDHYFIEDKFTWTNNPISFVGDGSEGLYRWELTKEAQKSMMGDDYDKYPTFHDYIVAKDLEKLTKEKKQGLGK